MNKGYIGHIMHFFEGLQMTIVSGKRVCMIGDGVNNIAALLYDRKI